MGGFNSTASIISGIIGAELERFMSSVRDELGSRPTRTIGEWKHFVVAENSCDWRGGSPACVLWRGTFESGHCL